MSNNTDTIVAQATAIGRGSVGIIRVSGPNAKAIATKVTNKELKPRHATYLPFFTGDTTPLDYGLAIFFPNPHSFTGEDVVEFQGHGGPVVQQALQEFIVSTGLARYAQPGEFSHQAFVNGKLDLVQAEAIADLINASSLQAAKGAINSLQGEFSVKVHQIVDKLIRLRTYLEAGMDFPDEEIDILEDSFVQTELYSIQTQLEQIKASAQQGKILRDGISAVIVGQPNAGKSSLLNALSGEQSAIVTEIAGTTRDTLKEFIQIDGLPLHIIDTAGLRETADKVELIGIERAYQAMEKADVIIIVADSKDFTKELSLLPETIFEKDIPKILITNKIDQHQEQPWSNKQGNIYSLGLSAQTQAGLENLKEALKEIIGYNNTSEGTIIARQRHLQAIAQALEYFNNASFYLQQGVLPELIADDLRMAQNKLSEITGRFTADDLLTSIFSTFCIGK
ncbi:tRNA uridine-5-carboxymethylaminomethyl(34) synthesis GTPase MnmE [Psittacicella melopsittaci]|uniref:tRNA modification GTPase MnmE n=1 Tax=Psittacicella melopsittaci TaxID=2028576 RepID=A0A3A1Y726_9GAMM|nr:tRNA uridine-5-carboxymethylaminomethyl(34) synthesis GTPase MnmE [Psittacicella melopsittaci]RIY31864.1 tRNA uridine-5-carboxymethylaminomethyl(34) synthesis GTPase MnmE [Psittacicella melopsittaci]